MQSTTINKNKMKHLFIVIATLMLVSINTMGQHKAKDLIPLMGLTSEYPYFIPKIGLSNENRNDWDKDYSLLITNNDADSLGAVLYGDMGNLMIDNNVSIETAFWRRFKPIPSPICPNIILVGITNGADATRLLLASYDNNYNFIEAIEVHNNGYAINIDDGDGWIISKQFKLMYGGDLYIYELKSTRSTPVVYGVLTSSDYINCQRIDYKYSLNIETGKFILKSKTDYIPQDYPISYFYREGTDIWNGTETKIGTITY